MKSYFDQLKEKHETPEKAYFEYQLSKQYLRVFSCSQNAPQKIKEAMDLQEKINTWAREVIENPNNFVDFKKFIGLKQFNDKILSLFYKENSELLHFIGIEKKNWIDLLSSTYLLNLEHAAKNITWEKLEAIMLEEKNNVPILTKEETQEILDKTVKDYGLTSLSFGQIRTNEKELKNVGTSLEQLSCVIDIENEQIGKNLNLFIDTDMKNFINPIDIAGYANEYFNEQKIYINSRISNDSFAHEWFHAIDKMLAKHHKLTTQYASEGNFTSINKVLESSIQLNEDVIKELKQTINQKCLVHLLNIINRFDSTA